MINKFSKELCQKIMARLKSLFVCSMHFKIYYIKYKRYIRREWLIKVLKYLLLGKGFIRV